MDSWPKKAFWLSATVLSCFSNVHPISAAPSHPRQTGPRNEELYNASHPFAEFGVSAKKARDTSIPLRILPLGASIMSGTGGTTGNGCRKPLRDALRQDGYEVDMVGSLHTGTMVDHEQEAVPGDVLTQVLARVPHSLAYKPNIVIINAGTNDANTALSLSTAGNRMNDILNALWNAEDMSGTCIMVSTLIPTLNPTGITSGPTINSQYRALVTQRAAEGKCIYLAEMWPNGDDDAWFNFDTDYLAGENPHVHPNDKGHSMMASVFYNSIQSAISDNRIVTPGEMVDSNATVCDKIAGTGTDAGGLTQRGSGYDDGIYYHDSTAEGYIWELESEWDRGQWKFARLFHQNYDDLLGWVSTSDTSQVYAVFSNSADGKGTFKKIDDMNGDLNCEYPEGVNFIDMNGDGLDDLVYIDATGNAYLSINQGDGDASSGTPPTFKRVSNTAKIMDAKATREFVKLADIDGDGRGDYGTVDSDGTVNFWRNGGTGDAPEYWQALGQIFTGKGYEQTSGTGENIGTRFEDINGDGRDDLVWLDTAAAGHVWTNSRSCAVGKEGNGLKVAWREGFYTGTTSTKAYAGMGADLSATETNLRDRVHFARIYGNVNVFGNLPRQDYVFMQHNILAQGFETKHWFTMKVWRNEGAGGTKLKGDGNKYCNMMGHSNGMVDYVWAYQGGTMEMWANRGKGSISDSDADGYWNYQGTIWTPPSEMHRKDLHLADWDGDGVCDIIYAEPVLGLVTVWINNYPTTNSWSNWKKKSYPLTQSCLQHRGLGLNDLAVRFADLTGNGFADYLCISPDSTVGGYIHSDDDSFSDYVQIKIPIAKDRANLQWADVNGDGREDMIWTEKFSGDAYVWYNNGQQDPSQAAGSSFGWTAQNTVAYAGQVAGSCEYFADLNGDGFADEHYLSDGTFNNEARTSLSPGCGLSDKTGDDSDMTSYLPLPTVPGSGSGAGSGLPTTGEGCVSGSGSGDYAELCAFTCARGYCPTPCSCASTGTYDAGTEDAIIDGYAGPGYDQTTYNPLCNFACSHDYCPDDKCVSTMSINTAITNDVGQLETLDDYDNTDDDVLSDGAFYRYQFSDTPNTAISVLYAGSQTELPSGMTCDDVTPGPDGAFLGCVGDTIQWLLLSLAADTTPLVGRRDTDTGNHTFTPLSHWEAEPHCSTHCQLHSRAPRKRWTPVGEGTMNGYPRSLHFMHTGKGLLYKATAGTLAQHQTRALEERQVQVLQLGALLAFSGSTNTPLYSMLDMGFNPDRYKVNVKHLTHVGMDAAERKRLKSCVFVATNDSSIVDLGTAPQPLGMMVGTDVALAVSADEVDSFSLTCEDEVKNRRKYVIWPTDGNDVAALRTQLFLFDPATEEHISVNSGYGTMYFTSFLTMTEVGEVSANKQAKEVELHCTNNYCHDPDLFSNPAEAMDFDKVSQSMPTQVKVNNTDIPSELRERDGLWDTQSPARPELAFGSTPDGSTRADYVYDASPARRVRVYLLDSKYIDTSLTDFTTEKDSTGKTIQEKMGTTDYIQVGPATANTGNDHGTAMLTFIAGGIHGIARESQPYGVTWQFGDGKQWIIDSLDKIEAHWKTQIAAGTYAPVAVLSMSFGVEHNAHGGAWETSFATRLKNLRNLGMLSVAAAGNDGKQVHLAPALFGDTGSANYVDDILVVGAVDNAGVQWTSSAVASWVGMYAPGVNVELPWNDPTTGNPATGSGTSIATAYTAGLATSFLGLPVLGPTITSPKNLRQTLIDKSYVRQLETCIYNGAPA